jgi:type I restriction enzyme S subunit
VSKEQDTSGIGRGKFHPYPQYKDSGVEWLGKIPAHWGSHRLKTLLDSIESGRREDSVLIGDDNAAFSIGGEHIGTSGQMLLSNERFISGLAYERMTNGRVHEGDVLLVKDGATIGKTTYVAILPFPRVAVNEHVFILRPKNDMSACFLYYLISSDLVQSQIDLSVRGAAQPGLPSSFAGGVIAPFPSLGEQIAIAAFLERETGKIDALIKKKERLIELLQEKRTVLITQAVTKGLDPNVPMKDSGVDWLGKIPAHWAVMQLKQLVPEITVGIVVTPAKYYVDDGIPCLRSLNISQGSVCLDDLVFISQEANETHKKSKIFENDIVVVRTGQAGTAAIIPRQLDGANCIDLLIIRHSEHLKTKYIFYYLNSEVAISQADALSVGAIQAHYNTATLAKLLIPVIPLREQEGIISYLEERTAELDILSERVASAIDHLKEYRTGLISAAVTGKIDIRKAQ